MGAVSRDARLLFILLWTIADDSGRLRGNSRLLASLLFPYDADSRNLISGWMAELEREKCLIPYEVGGHSYVQITNWSNHQKIDKPSGSKFPPFDESSRILSNPLEGSSLDQGRDQGVDQGKDQGMDQDAPVKFVKPSLDEVRAFMMGKDSLIADVQSKMFWDFYESKGWKVGDQKMQKWKAAASGWLTRSKEKRKESNSPMDQSRRALENLARKEAEGASQGGFF
jgi:hypothetical protein